MNPLIPLGGIVVLTVVLAGGLSVLWKGLSCRSSSANHMSDEWMASHTYTQGKE